MQNPKQIIPDTIIMDLFESQVATDKVYQSHKIYSLLNSLIDFYNAVYVFGPDFITNGIVKGVLNIDKVVCASLSGTLDSMRVILKEGRINDAYALMRKYNDGIIVVLYINIYIKQNCSIEKYIVDDMQQWVDNKRKLPSSEKMMKVIRNYKPLEDLEQLFDFDNLYLKIRRLANGNTHYNKLYYLWLNNAMIYNSSRIKELDVLYYYTLQLFIFHFAYMYSLNPHYMMSSDYVDALDLGFQPEEGSQYWVAGYVSDVFEKYITTRPEVAEYMRKHSGMNL